MPIFPLNLSPELKTKAKQKAKLQDKTLSEYIRDLMWRDFKISTIPVSNDYKSSSTS